MTWDSSYLWLFLCCVLIGHIIGRETALRKTRRRHTAQLLLFRQQLEQRGLRGIPNRRYRVAIRMFDRATYYEFSQPLSRPPSIDLEPGWKVTHIDPPGPDATPRGEA